MIEVENGIDWVKIISFCQWKMGSEFAIYTPVWLVSQRIVLVRRRILFSDRYVCTQYGRRAAIIWLQIMHSRARIFHPLSHLFFMMSYIHSPIRSFIHPSVHPSLKSYILFVLQSYAGEQTKAETRKVRFKTNDKATRKLVYAFCMFKLQQHEQFHSLIFCACWGILLW